MYRVSIVTLITGMLVAVFAVNSAMAETVTVRDGLDGYTGTHDATIVSNDGDTTRDYLDSDSRRTQESWAGTLSPYETTRSGPSYSTGLLRFDDLFNFAEITAGATIDSATLTLQVTNGIEGAYLAVMTTAWDESTVTWNQFGSGNPADGGGVTPGVDAETNPMSVSNLASAGSQDIDVTTTVQTWLDNPGTNYGWAIMRNDKNKGNFVASEEEVYTGERPTLTVVFTQVPEPGSLALLAMGTLGLLVAAWRRRK